MRTVTTPARAAGFTLIEAMVAVAIGAILAAVGVPSMAKWLQSRRIQAASGYYMDGFQTARNLAIEYNAASRLVFSQNAASGQMEWRADVCMPTSAVACTDAAAVWSTATAPITDGNGRNVSSVTRSAAGLPSTAAMNVVFVNGYLTTYFTPMGWLNTAAPSQLTRVQVDAVPSSRTTTVVVALTLAGMPTRCMLNKSAPDPRACPS